MNLVRGRRCDFEKVSDLGKASDLGKVNDLGKACDFGKVSDFGKFSDFKKISNLRRACDCNPFLELVQYLLMYKRISKIVQLRYVHMATFAQTRSWHMSYINRKINFSSILCAKHRINKLSGANTLT